MCGSLIKRRKKMNVLKGILLTIGSILATAVVVVLMWACLYLTVPNIKTETDKLFKWNDYAVTETEKEETETPKTANMIPSFNEFIG